MTKHTIRIVGGTYRRTPIPVIESEGVRPTPDRVRETVFNWLTHLWAGDFHDKQVLDLFAGSGALGFESASRGVAHVLMVEKDLGALAALRKIRDKLDAKTVRVHAGGAIATLARMDASRFDLIFLDPPFNQDWLTRLWPLLPAVMAPNALIYAESEAPLLAPDGYEILRAGKAGSVHYHLLQFAALRK